PLPMPAKIWSSIFMDFIDSLPKSQGSWYVSWKKTKEYAKIWNSNEENNSKRSTSHFSGSTPHFRVKLVDMSLTAREEAIEVCKFHLKRAHDMMKSQAKKHKTFREYVVGDWVYLKLKPHKQVTIRKGKQHKLYPKYYGPFQVVARVGQVAYKLKLPDLSQIHNVFHMSQLKKCKGVVSYGGNLPACNKQGVMMVEP
nr:retrotransposable element Tf2 [Tanacetum cinerariifolium]